MYKWKSIPTACAKQGLSRDGKLMHAKPRRTMRHGRLCTSNPCQKTIFDHTSSSCLERILYVSLQRIVFFTEERKREKSPSAAEKNWWSSSSSILHKYYCVMFTARRTTNKFYIYLCATFYWHKYVPLEKFLIRMEALKSFQINMKLNEMRNESSYDMRTKKTTGKTAEWNNIMKED